MFRDVREMRDCCDIIFIPLNKLSSKIIYVLNGFILAACVLLISSLSANPGR